MRALPRASDTHRLLIGRDTRESGEWIGRELAHGARGAGGSVTGAGVTSSPVTLNGKAYMKYDFGDQGTTDYVLAENGHVFVIITSDAALAAQAAAALP